MEKKITKKALKNAFGNILSPVIIKVKRGYLDKVQLDLADFIEGINRVRPRLLENIPQPFNRMRRIQNFDMISCVLPREKIFDMIDSNNHVKKIYHDQLIKAFNVPYLPPEALYNIPRIRGKEKQVQVTTTYFTRRLMGITDNIRYTGRGTLVSVLDTGAVRLHEQRPNVIDYDTTLTQSYDGNGHGSWCVNCIGGKIGYSNYLESKNGKAAPVIGMAPNCSIASIKCLGYYIGTGSTSGIIEAVDIAGNNNSNILSMSLGGEIEVDKPEDDPFYEVFSKIIHSGIIPVVAAGNSGDEEQTINSPGCFDNVLSVGAYDPRDGGIAEFSSRGPTPWGDIKPDCIAPGVQIVSGTTGACARSDGVPDQYSNLSGTSMATPHVAGLLACMAESHKVNLGKNLNFFEVISMLQSLGQPKSNSSGYGMITWDMYKAWLSTQYGVTID